MKFRTESDEGDGLLHASYNRLNYVDQVYQTVFKCDGFPNRDSVVNGIWQVLARSDCRDTLA